MNATLPITLTSTVMAGLEEPQQAVEAGRESLDKWWSSYPWYDSANDGVGRVDVSPPWRETWNWDGLDFGWNWDWLDFGWDWSFSLPDSPLQWLSWIVVAVLLILVAWLLIRAYRDRVGSATSRAGKGSAEADEDDAARIESLPFSVASGRLDLLAEARKHYQQGDYGKAVVYLFSFQLVELDKHHRIHLTKGKTNRQYMREVGTRRPLRALVEQTMVAFEDVFFGHMALDRQRFETCWSRLDEFRARVMEQTG